MKMKMSKPKPIDPVKVEDISPDDLFLDARNPRLTGQKFRVEDQDEILRFLWKDKEVSELVDSIAYNGYWRQEVLFAVKEAGELVVVEGNRRLAAVKLLKSSGLCRDIGARGVPADLPDRITKTYDKLPVIVCTRVDLWMYMGFKHVNGPQEWDSIAKAEYIARVHEEFGIPLPVIANTIGDRHDTAKRLYYGLAVLRQAEEEGVFCKDNSWGKRFPYSHLWTGLGYASIQRFLGIKPDEKMKPKPVPREKISRLGELCLWLFGNKKDDIKPLIKSQNPDLRRLSEVLTSEKGYAALRNGEGLDVSWRLSRGDEAMLREALVAAERALREAHGYLPTGYKSDNNGLLQQGETVFKLAEAIFNRMHEKKDKSG